MARIVAVTAQPFETPLHHLFVTSRGSTKVARAVVITVKLDGHIVGHGESVPVAYVTGESQESVIAMVERITPHLLNANLSSLGPVMHLVSNLAPDAPSARCGIEMALLTAWSRLHNMSLWSYWGGSVHRCESDLTIPIVDEAPALALEAFAKGIKTLKVKVGGGEHGADMARVISIHKAVPDATLRIDANQAFTAREAVSFVNHLLEAGINIELFEQPTRHDDIAGLIEVAEACNVPVYADESCKTPQDAIRLANTPVKGYNLKINKFGILGVIDMIAIARAAHKDLMLGCMLESRRSIAVGMALACGTGAFKYLDLDSHLLLKEEGENGYFTQQGGCMELTHQWMTESSHQA